MIFKKAQRNSFVVFDMLSSERRKPQMFGRNIKNMSLNIFILSCFAAKLNKLEKSDVRLNDKRLYDCQ